MKKIMIITISLLISICANSQTIRRIAGNRFGSSGYWGNGGLASSDTCNLQEPSGLAKDAAGNLYIADYNNNVIRKVNTSGIISHFAGNILGHDTCCGIGDGGPAYVAQLNRPIGLAIDDSGNMYVGDWGNSRIRKINSSGIISTLVDSVYCNGDLTVDNLGNLYGAGDIGIFKVNTTTGAYSVLPTDSISTTYGIAVDGTGNIYVSCNILGAVFKRDPTGVVTRVAGTGTWSYGGDGGPATAAQLDYPKGLALDASGDLYIAEQYSGVIRKINTLGIISTVAGNITQRLAGFIGDGGSPTSAALQDPEDVLVDAAGSIFISQTNMNVIRQVGTHFLGVDEMQKTVLSSNVYPNPTTGEITISDISPANIKIYNSLGQKIKEIKNSNRISIYEYPAGLYIVLIFDNEGSLLQQSKIIKE